MDITDCQTSEMQAIEARELELRRGPSYTLVLHHVAADAKLNKISEEGLAGKGAED